MSDLPDWVALAAMPRAFGGAPLSAQVRAQAEDFVVDEILGFEPDGEGDHALLSIRKSGMNTEQLARALGRLAGVRPIDVGYCGLKDRHAVTTQWFSVAMAGRCEPDWAALEDDRVRIVAVHRHRRKLRRGAAKGNGFRIRLRDAQGDRDAAEAVLDAVARRGVPNYFGEQRFGREYANLHDAHALFAGELKRVKPHLRGLYLSAARSQIFNEVLAERVRLSAWDQVIPGDLMQLDGSHSWFVAEPGDPDIGPRLQRFDIHPTAPLWGRGGLPGAGDAARLEAAVAQRFTPWCEGIERFGLKQERRGTRMLVRGLTRHWDDEGLVLEFSLATGCFATAVLRELM